ncbi:hypothetical protein JZ785_21015 [Alicyclobacillus curvatus]|jgi:sugar (pentulose or hexulose) kinase|nr:hypothetical protein JZ785_21015 [Alicyclobacillus curvatus]
MDRYLCLDIGTSWIKASLISSNGEVLDMTSTAVPATLEEIYETSTALVYQFLRRRVKCGEVTCIGVSTQMSGLVLLDQYGDTLHPFVQGVVGGTAESVRWFSEQGPGSSVTGCPLNAYAPAVKLLDFVQHSPENARRVNKVGGLKEYLLLRWTGQWVTDGTCASTTMVYDQVRRTWLEYSCFPWGTEVYPNVSLPWSVAGYFLDTETPMIVGIGDGPAAGLACGAIRPGILSLSLGTTAVLRWSEESVVPLRDGDFRHLVDEQHFFCGRRVVGSGRAIEWAHELFGNDISDVSVKLPTFTLLADEWMWSGVQPVTKEQMLCSVYVGIFRPFLETLQEYSLIETAVEFRLIGGGAADENWRRILYQMTGIPVRSYQHVNGTIGTAVLCHMNRANVSLEEAVHMMVEKHGT